MIKSAVVKVFATVQEPDYSSPWQTRLAEQATGSGVLIGPNRVLTGAHVVANATFIELQKIRDPDKAIARVVAVCHDSDLALLEVEDPAFLAGITPAPLGDLPDLEDRVSVLGYPVGGEELSVTEGVVSRIEVQCYSHSERYLMAVTVDAAINDGNSGGPVVMEGKVVGIAFQSMDEAENIGEMVPPPLIRHFLKCVDEGLEPTVPSLSIAWQTMQNPVMRLSLGLDEGASGVLVTHVDYGGAAWGVLQAGDVVMNLGGYPIANNGTIFFDDKYRMALHAVLGMHYVGQNLSVQVLRDRKVLDLTVELKAPAHLVPMANYDKDPTYFIYGGIVFQPLTLDYLEEWNTWHQKAPRELVQTYYRGVRSEEQQQYVVVTQILADRVTVGYESISEQGVLAVNGQQPRDLLHLIELVEAEQGLLKIDLTKGMSIVLQASEVRAATPRILERYRVPRDRSPDL
ncbi:MAG: trypsin-like peptidase domain-containing protein [Planctomycetes bacterium]|nr:trypsin-like peptidase domain-containing protein [Planctomycetota bacterium]